MSYEIDQFKVKKIDKLTIPISELYVSAREDWKPEKPKHQEDGTVIIECGCEQNIIGILNNNILEIKEFNMTGEGSGSFMHYVLEDALTKSTGYLEVVLIWESGDYIEKMAVNNGIISREEIAL